MSEHLEPRALHLRGRGSRRLQLGRAKGGGKVSSPAVNHFDRAFAALGVAE